MTIDLDAYCRRIGYSGERVPTLETLRAVHELHPRNIAFENLDPLLGRPVRLDAASLQGKMLHGGRGGYCFEHNLLFGHALKAMGFKVRELIGRPRWRMPDSVITPRIHMLLLIDLEQTQYVADVGFGGNTLTGPLLLHSREEQLTPHELARIVEAAGQWSIQAKIRGGWATIYIFDLSEQLLVDLETSNWWASTHPVSPFVNELRLARTEVGGRYTLRNNELARHRLNSETERSVLRTVPELRDALTDIFLLRLAEIGEFDKMLARFAIGEARSG